MDYLQSPAFAREMEIDVEVLRWPDVSPEDIAKQLSQDEPTPPPNAAKGLGNGGER